MSARVPKQAFVVTPIQRAGQNEPGKPVEGTRKVVLDALFSGVYQADARDRLIIARAHVAPKSARNHLTRDDLRRIIMVAHAQDAGCVDLVGMAELDPSTAFRGAVLRGADLRGEDLAGFNLDGANLDGVDLPARICV